MATTHIKIYIHCSNTAGYLRFCIRTESIYSIFNIKLYCDINKYCMAIKDNTNVTC